MARLYSVAHYAIGDPRRPLRITLVRVACSTALGYTVAIVLPPRLGIDPLWGAAGLTASSGLVGWLEFSLLRASMNVRIGTTGLRAGYTVRLWIAAIAAAAVALGAKLLLPPLDPLLRAAAVLPIFGVVYIAIAFVLRIPVPGRR